MSKGAVYVHNRLAGHIWQDSEGYHFAYLPAYLRSEAPEPVSLTLPLTGEEYQSTTIFPFFDGLIPEGWLLDIAEHTWKLNPRDRMGLLLACCSDCIGAVSIHPLKEER